MVIDLNNPAIIPYAKTIIKNPGWNIPAVNAIVNKSVIPPISKPINGPNNNPPSWINIPSIRTRAPG